MLDAIARSMCGAMLPKSRAVDVTDGLAFTPIDTGMPVVGRFAADFDLTAGPLLNLCDVASALLPKGTRVPGAVAGGAINTRSKHLTTPFTPWSGVCCGQRGACLPSSRRRLQNRQPLFH